jgi:putative aldouronate transport system substrate-binding protein
MGLALAMLLGMAAVNGTVAASEEPYQLVMYWEGNGDTDQRALVEAAVNEYIEPLIGANITYTIIGWADWVNKAITSLQAGEKIDLFFTADWNFYMRSARQDLFLPLNDPNGPYGNLLELYGQDILNSLSPSFILGSQIDGINYAVPTNKELCVPSGWIYNIDTAEEVGFDVSTLEQPVKDPSVLEPYLAAYKELYPDLYPFIPNFDIDFVPNFADGLDEVISVLWDPLPDGSWDETIYIKPETEQYRRHCELMYDWMQKGYINPDAILTTYQGGDDRNAGRFLFEAQPLKGYNIKGGELMNASGNPDLRLDEFYGNMKVAQTQDTGGSMFAIPVTSEDPVKAMQYLNLMHSDVKLINMMLFGVEGTHWQLADDGRVEILDANWTGAHAGAWTVGDILLQYVTTKEDPEKNRLLIEYADDALSHFSLGFRFDQTPVNDEIAGIRSIIEIFDRSIRNGGIDPSTGIPEYLEMLKAAGIDKVLAEVQVQYDAWKAAKAANE